MLKISIDLISANGTTRDARVGDAEITNDGTGDNVFANYDVVLKKTGTFSKKPGTPWKTGHVKCFARAIYGPYDLLYLALEDALGAHRIAKLRQLQASKAEQIAEQQAARIETQSE